MMTRWLVIGAGLIAVLAPGSAFAGEGFGSVGKTVVTLNRTRPPEVLLPGTRIAIKATANDPKDQGLAARLGSLLQVQLPQNDKRLSISAAKPETTISVAIVRNEGHTEWETRVYRSKDKNGYVTERSVRYLLVRHDFGATYSATDVRSGANLDSTAIDIAYAQEFQEGNGAPTLEQVAGESAEKAVVQITARLTFTKEPVQVILPEGSLDQAKRYAQAGLWNKYQEALEAMPAKVKPKDEAYRQFALGVAYEALGYAADNPDVALNYLEQASLLYTKAVEMKPEEQFFLEAYGGLGGSVFKKGGITKKGGAQPPIARVQEAVVQYQKVKELKAALERGDTVMMASAGGAKSLDASSAMDNSAVIDMVQAGIAEDVILTAITSAPQTSFDVSPTGLIQLSKGGVKGNLLRQVQATATGTKAPVTAAATGAPAARPRKRAPQP